MKKTVLISMVLTLYLFKSYSQDSVKIFERKVLTEVRVHDRPSVYNNNQSSWSSKTKKVKRFFYQIGEQNEKKLQGNDYKLYKEYISSNKNAKKNLKNYAICAVTGVAGGVAIIVGLPVLLVSAPAGLICIGVGLVTVGTSKLLGKQFLFKSARVFNKGLKKER